MCVCVSECVRLLGIDVEKNARRAAVATAVARQICHIAALSERRRNFFSCVNLTQHNQTLSVLSERRRNELCSLGITLCADNGRQFLLLRLQREQSVRGSGMQSETQSDTARNSSHTHTYIRVPFLRQSALALHPVVPPASSRQLNRNSHVSTRDGSFFAGVIPRVNSGPKVK